MRKFKKHIKVAIIFMLLLGMTQNAYAEKAKKNGKKGLLVKSINDAMQRSESEQDRIKIRFDTEADERIDSWQVRDRDMIEIKHSGSSLEPVSLGMPDYSYEESGIDQSGLNGLHGDYKEEPIEIDFDKELRDVSSIKD